MAEVALSGPRRLSDFVGLLRRAPSLAELDRLRAEGVQAILDTRQRGGDFIPIDPDALATALRARDMDYARLALPKEEPETLLDRFGETVRSLRKPLVIVSPIGDSAGLFALAHIAIEQGTPGEAMLEMAGTLGVDQGSAETRRRTAAYVNEAEKRPNNRENRERLASAGSPSANRSHERAMVMHAEVKAIEHPLRSAANELSVQVAAGASVVGLLGALLVDRRLGILALIGMGYLAQRAWPLISRPIVVAENAVVPRSEVERLRQRLDRLKSA